MREFWEEHALFAGLSALLLLLSILCRFITGMQLKKLQREAGNLSATENPLLRQCRLKYQNYYELNGGTVNTTVFVEKFMQGIRLGGCSLRFWEQLGGQLLLLSVFADGLGSCLGIIDGRTLGEVLPFYLLAFLSLYLYFSAAGLIDTAGRREALKTTIADFLENRMAERIRGVQRDLSYLEKQEALRQKEETAPQGQAQKKEPDQVRDPELEALLREFLA
ncbi:MAG: hypothetical protein Q4C65_03675 [Eubacteriales bacterium]|nr:hypothetical protein [Eubacteriales bacterium]